MQQQSDDFFKAIRASHTVAFGVDAIRNGVTVASDLPLTGGSVTVDASSATRRQLSATFAETGGVYDVLSQPGTEVRVRRGVLLSDGTVEMAQCGVFQVTGPSLSYTGKTVTVSAPDRWNTITRSRFVQPKQWDSTWVSVDQAVGALVLGPWVDRHAVNPAVAIPAFVNSMTGTGAAQKALVWSRDRGQAITDLATSIGGEVFFDPFGGATLRPTPVQGRAVWDADASPAGVLTDVSTSRSYETSYNTVVVSGLDSSGNTVVTAVAQITDPVHPLWIGGNFGIVPYFYSSQLISTTAQALQVAQTLRDTAAAVGSEVAATCLPNPALETGDTIRVWLPDGTTEDHVLTGFTIPLTVTDVQSLTLQSTRGSDLPAET